VEGGRLFFFNGTVGAGELGRGGGAETGFGVGCGTWATTWDGEGDGVANDGGDGACSLAMRFARI